MRSTASATHELSRNQRIRVLLICCMSLFIVGLDVTVVNVALPSIERELHAGISGLQWTVDAYTVVIASLLLLLGLDGGPGRPQAHVRHRPRRVLARLGAVRPGAERRPAGRLPRAPGGRRARCSTRSRCRSSPTPSRPARARTGGRHLGRGVRRSPWRSVRSSAARSSSAFGWRPIFWINLPVGLAAIVLTLRLRPRVAGAAGAAVRPRRPGARDRAPVRADLRDHRGARAADGPRRSSWPRSRRRRRRSLALLVYEPRRDEPLIDLRFFRSTPVRLVDRHLGGRVRRVRRVPLPEHACTSRRCAASRRCRPGSRPCRMAAGDGRRVAALGPHRRPARAAAAAPDRRCRLVTACAMLTSHRRRHPAGAAARRLRGLRARHRVGQRTDHERRRLRDAARPGGRRLGDRHDLAPGRPTLGVAIVGAIVALPRRRPRRTSRRRATRRWWMLTACGARRAALGFTATTPRARASARRTAVELNPEALVA